MRRRSARATQARRPSRGDRPGPGGSWSRRSRPRRRSRPTCATPTTPSSGNLNCLNKYLNRLAKNLNATISKLQQTQADLYGLYDCIQAVPVSWYMGYWYGNMTSGFETTALDYTADPSIEEFECFGVIDPTCVVPAS